MNTAIALLPVGVGWRTAIERIPTHALAVRRSISHGLRLICNLMVRLPYKAGKLFLRPLVQYPQKSDGGVFHAFCFSPVHSAEPLFLGSIAAVHGQISSEGTKKCPTKEFPKTERKFPRVR